MREAPCISLRGSQKPLLNGGACEDSRGWGSQAGPSAGRGSADVRRHLAGHVLLPFLGESGPDDPGEAAGRALGAAGEAPGEAGAAQAGGRQGGLGLQRREGAAAPGHGHLRLGF